MAAANRARQAIADYEQAPAAEEALSILVTSYDRMGLVELRDAADRVLRKNFPKSRYLADNASAKAKPWWRFW